MQATKRKERSIIFSGESIPRLLDSSKTQFREVLKPQPPEGYVWNASYGMFSDTRSRLGVFRASPYHVGQKLWVCETFTLTQHNKAAYRADARDADGYRWHNIIPGDPKKEVRWRPSAQMPRWASRITLEVTDVRVEQSDSGNWEWVVEFKLVEGKEMPSKIEWAKKLVRKAKWRIAEFLDDHTEMCWANLVSWALYGDLKFFDGNNEFSSKQCQKDCDRAGSCYCGKYQDGVTHDAMPGAGE